MALNTGVFNNLRGFADYARAEDEFQARKQQLEIEQQLKAAKIANMQRGGDLPAPLQLANEYQKRVAAGDVHGANLIAQFAKINDKGVIADEMGVAVPVTGYGDALAAIAAPKAGATRQAEKNVDLRMNPMIASGEANARNESDLSYKPKIKVAEDSASSAAKKTMAADDTLDIIGKIEQPDTSGLTILDKATGSTPGAALAAGKSFFGKSDEATQANAQLQVYGSALVNNVPRMEGPQSDADRQFYVEQAGKIADPRVPAQDKKASLRAIKQLRAKYASNPDNDAIAALTGQNIDGSDVIEAPAAPPVAPKMTLKEKSEAIFNAQKAAKAGKSKAAIRQRLIDNGIDPAEAGL